MILYRKAPSLRIARASVPEPPYWAATTLLPYGLRRGTPVAIDYLALTATAFDRHEVSVCDNVADELERATLRHRVHEPALIEATESSEIVYRRGDDALRFCDASGVAPMFLTSSRGSLPPATGKEVTVVIAAWPLDFARLERLFEEARSRAIRWGVAVPVMFPVTTDLQALARLGDAAHGAAFFAALPVEPDPAARKALADSLPDLDRETYEILFHADLDPVHVATERHIAALAAEIGTDDFVVPPRWERRSNWNGAVLLTLTASRMLAMKHDVETAWRIARSARVVAQLEKAIERIAAAANLSIVEALDELSVEALTEWVESGRSSFVDHINKQWRLRLDGRT